MILVFLVIGILGSAGSNSSSDTSTASDTSSTDPSNTASSDSADAAIQTVEEPEPISYIHLDVTELFDALSSNALKAESTYQDQYVEITGYLSVIDSDGKYIGVGADPDDYTYLLQNVQCYIKSDEQREQILEMTTGDPITVRGKIKSIGEVLGYSLNIDSIN